MKALRTPTLEIAYEESGPAEGRPVVLLHGFPDDVHAYDGVAPPLAAAGWRVLVPYLRGYGPTRFLDPLTPRSGQQAALGHARRADGEPKAAVPAVVAAMVAQLAVRRCDLRADRGLLRQSRFCRGGDPVLSPPL